MTLGEVNSEVVTESEAARRLGMSSSGLRKWRNEGTGPRFVRCGRLVRYLARDLEAWLDTHAVEGETREATGRA